jgi:hypothetical protein
MTRDEINETIALLLKTTNIIQVQYCQKVLNNYMLHNLLPHQKSNNLCKRLKEWNIQVNVRIIQLELGIEMPNTIGRLAEIKQIIEAVQNAAPEKRA